MNELSDDKRRESLRTVVAVSLEQLSEKEFNSLKLVLALGLDLHKCTWSSKIDELFEPDGSIHDEVMDAIRFVVSAGR